MIPGVARASPHGARFEKRSNIARQGFHRRVALFGLPAKGRLNPGRDADIVLFDPELRLRLTPETLHSPLPFASYQGVELHGWPVTTISRGEVIVDDGVFVGEPGRGRFLERAYERG